MESNNCKECGKVFNPPEDSKYLKLYCDKCSKQRKKDYQNIHLITAEECEEE